MNGAGIYGTKRVRQTVKFNAFMASYNIPTQVTDPLSFSFTLLCSIKIDLKPKPKIKNLA